MQSCQFSKSVSEKRARKVLRSTACCRFVGSVTLQSQWAVLPESPRDVGNGFQSGASAKEAVLENANSVAPRAKYPSSLL